jgi:ADP-ribosyl-[dinitrogen reductase] hydrolase
MLLDPSFMQGYLKHAFVLSFYCLLRVDTMTFDDCLRLALELAGDTDTNACIMGGMIGAYFGKSSLPSEKVRKCLECDINQGTKAERPSEF